MKRAWRFWKMTKLRVVERKRLINAGINTKATIVGSKQEGVWQLVAR
jgi:hypothetical protein